MSISEITIIIDQNMQELEEIKYGEYRMDRKTKDKPKEFWRN